MTLSAFVAGCINLICFAVNLTVWSSNPNMASAIAGAFTLACAIYCFANGVRDASR